MIIGEERWDCLAEELRSAQPSCRTYLSRLSMKQALPGVSGGHYGELLDCSLNFTCLAAYSAKQPNIGFDARDVRSGRGLNSRANASESFFHGDLRSLLRISKVRSNLRKAIVT